jgi:GTP-binding protein EngB required for normal cell division
MKLLADDVDASGLSGRLAALDRVVEVGRGRLDPPVLAAAEQLAGKAADRLRLGAQHTVVALAGTTGSGKSTLFNAVIGQDISATGLRRPTTSAPYAAVWGATAAVELLDWLDVGRRHQVAGSEELDGLVLLDLPDVDSVQVDHRLEVDRLVELVDLVVWVVDPQKYADAALHDRYLAPLRAHADVMVVVFNQVDRVPPAARQGCLDDLGGLLRNEGLGGVPVLATSARTGEGVPALRERLVTAVAAHRAALRRLDADLRALAAELAETCTAQSGKTSRREVVAALTEASGAEAVAVAVARSHRSRTRAATGWPVTRWLSRIRRDPARRLGLPNAPSELVRTALPGPSAVQRAQIDTALRRLVDRSAGTLPEPWPAAITRAATGRRDDLPDLLDRAVAGAELGLRSRPRWWAAARALQTLLALVALVGAVWLLALFVLDWIRLPEPPLPYVHEAGWRLPVPTVLLLGGVLVGVVLGILGGRLGALGARRRGAAARRRIAARVEQVAGEAVFEPVERELAARADLCAAVATLSDRRRRAR